MTLFPLTNDEKSRLQRLNRDKATLFALKKLFINVACERPASYEVNFLAAQKIAINMLFDVFHDLEIIQPDNQTLTNRENLV